MNSILYQKVKSADSAQVSEWQNIFANAPIMLRLLHFLQSCPDNFSTADAVCFVYQINKGNTGYAQYENRFYKLRKKLYDTIQGNNAPVAGSLPEEQQWVAHAQTLLRMGKFKEAQTILIKTEKQCWRNNIFEILPDVLDMLIQSNQSLNTLKNNTALHKRFATALRLHSDLLEAKNIVRKIYEVNMQQGIKATAPLYNRLAGFITKHSAYPRFKLLYNFVAAYYKTGAGGPGVYNQTHIINRHIAAAKKLLVQYADMPAVHYLPGYKYNQTYRINEMQAFSYYNTLHYKKAGEEMLELFNLVMSDTQGYGRLKNEVLFTNTIHMLVSARQFGHAQRVAELFMQFVKENKLFERLPIVYYEFTNIQAAMHPAKSKYSDDFLLARMDEYIAMDSVKNSVGQLIPGYLLKAKLLMAAGRYAQALKIIQMPLVANSVEFGKLYKQTSEVLQQLIKRNKPALLKLKETIKRERAYAGEPAPYNWFRFLEELCDRALKQVSI